MKNRTMFLSAFAALTLLGAGARAADRPDSWITTKVKSELAAHKDVSAMHTHVTTEDGVVTLTGNAKTTAEKQLTEQYAAGVEGVKKVDNRLVVIAPRMRGESRMEKEGAGSAAIDKLDDASITARVKTALADHHGTSALHTDVDTKDGAVTLKGTAESDAQKTLAEKVARRVHGVRSVTNDLEVK
ncbi:MAG TPA: BON domain-containing protein [Elusimicrobiota bacterium]|nr:BON domain-containing protein [Elusimicrobiota bacterium]